MLSSGWMTALGFVGAMLAFLQTAIASEVGGTEELPTLVVLIIGMLNAGVTFMLGKTNPGSNGAAAVARKLVLWLVCGSSLLLAGRALATLLW